MKFTLVCILFLTLREFVNGYTLIQTEPATVNENDTPIIGVLTQEVSYYFRQKYPNQYNSYIAASYIKFIEGAGGRVVPIWIGQSREYYENIIDNLNGVLFPGGNTWFNATGGYSEAGRYIYEKAIQLNENGTRFPLWGTCLGFEFLTYLSSGEKEHRAHCSSMNQALPLEFKSDFRQSRLYAPLSDDLSEILATQNLTANFHQFCVTPQNITSFGLDRDWRVMSVNHDWNGLEFVSSIEHKQYPFYGVQFHPEKNLYEWVLNKNITHTPDAIRSSQYFADFFVNEARKNVNRFLSKKVENDFLIYNYSPIFTGKNGSSFLQSYLFTDQDVQSSLRMRL